MTRKERIRLLVNKRRKTTMDYYKWLSTPREYYPGDFLYMREVHILMEIGPSGIDNVSELGPKLQITQGAVSQQLAKLEKRGYLVRIQDKSDKRQYSVRLTEKGLHLYERHQQFDERNYEQMFQYFDDFSEEELEIVKRFEEQFEKAVVFMRESKME